jgi:hypothetical protein
MMVLKVNETGFSVSNRILFCKRNFFRVMRDGRMPVSGVHPARNGFLCLDP